MAVGDAAVAGGLPILDPGTALLKNGATEINRTRDFVANVQALLPANKPAYRVKAGISSGTSVPSNATGNDGDIFFRTL